MKILIITATIAVLAVIALFTNTNTLAQTVPAPRIYDGNAGVEHVAFANVTFYLNATDNNHYHVKGLVQNTLPVTRDQLWLYLSFQNSGITVHLLPAKLIKGPINPKGIARFDIDTGYNTTQAYQFRYLNATILAA
jgi:hypothetical protein